MLASTVKTYQMECLDDRYKQASAVPAKIANMDGLLDAHGKT